MTNEKQQKETQLELFNDYFSGTSTCKQQAGINEVRGGDVGSASNEESVAQEFAKLFRVTRVGGSLVFTGSYTTFESPTPNGTSLLLRRTR